jgi:hypothetical protein
MKYVKAHVENGRIVEDTVIEKDQATITADCWTVQFQGLKACEKCEYKGKPRKCGGGQTLKRLLGQA